MVPLHRRLKDELPPFLVGHKPLVSGHGNHPANNLRAYIFLLTILGRHYYRERPPKAGSAYAWNFVHVHSNITSHDTTDRVTNSLSQNKLTQDHSLVKRACFLLIFW